jgi:hypothetical protein
MKCDNCEAMQEKVRATRDAIEALYLDDKCPMPGDPCGCAQCVCRRLLAAIDQTQPGAQKPLLRGCYQVDSAFSIGKAGQSVVKQDGLLKAIHDALVLSPICEVRIIEVPSLDSPRIDHTQIDTGTQDDLLPASFVNAAKAAIDSQPAEAQPTRMWSVLGNEGQRISASGMTAEETAIHFEQVLNGVQRQYSDDGGKTWVPADSPERTLCKTCGGKELVNGETCPNCLGYDCSPAPKEDK